LADVEEVGLYMFEIKNIESDRDKKLLTLLTNQVSSVLADLEKQLFSIKDHVDLKKIQSTLDFTMAQDYGTSELARYYVTHPLRVTSFILNWMIRNKHFDSKVIETTLAHNVIEKGVLTAQELESFISPWAAHTISILTQNRDDMKNPSKKQEYYDRIYQLDRFGQLIKYFDKFDNLYAICLNPDSTIRTHYIQEIEDYVRIIGVRFDQDTIPYFDALIENSKNRGYYRPAQEI